MKLTWAWLGSAVLLLGGCATTDCKTAIPQDDEKVSTMRLVAATQREKWAGLEESATFRVRLADRRAVGSPPATLAGQSTWLEHQFKYGPVKAGAEAETLTDFSLNKGPWWSPSYPTYNEVMSSYITLATASADKWLPETMEVQVGRKCAGHRISIRTGAWDSTRGFSTESTDSNTSPEHYLFGADRGPY
jgi:hypothetical protein